MNYCDGLSFTGDRDDPVVEPSTNTTLYFRGKRILTAVLDALATNHGLKNARRVIVSGNSAGGLTVYLHLDQIAAIIKSSAVAPDATVYGFPDGGFFIDIPNAAGVKTYEQRMAVSSKKKAFPRWWGRGLF